MTKKKAFREFSARVPHGAVTPEQFCDELGISAAIDAMATDDKGFEEVVYELGRHVLTKEIVKRWED